MDDGEADGVQTGWGTARWAGPVRVQRTEAFEYHKTCVALCEGCLNRQRAYIYCFLFDLRSYYPPLAAFRGGLLTQN
jgi:hypothetical protein